MTNEISCPRCGKLILPQNRYCEHCGVDLAVAAALAEQSVIYPPATIPTGVPIAPEVLVPRMGDYMIEQGLLTSEDLQRALKYQKERYDAGQPILLGQALLELGVTSKETLDQVITMQILNLQNALNDANRHLKQRVQDATRDLKNALERLSELNQLKSNFIANISHELRTPLTHIKGYLDLLAEGGLGPLTPSQEEAINVLKRAEGRLEQLIEDLIQFSMASRGELSLNQNNTHIDKLIEVIVDRSRQKALPKDITLNAVIAPKLPAVHIDEDKIGWVLMQLLDNAIKFTDQAGKIQVRASAHQGVVTVAVIDSGIGIPEDRILEIFEPFHQLDGSTTRRYSGTGLGLAMVRRILETHGSQIKVRSVVGKGSSFEFSLPAAKDSETTADNGYDA